MSLFGSSTPQKPAFTFPTPAAPTTSTGTMFGSTTPSKPLFGSTSQASSTPSLFGTTTTPTASSGGGLFGKPTTTTTSTSSAGTLFGAAPATSAAPSLFGSTTTSANTTDSSARLLRLEQKKPRMSRELTRREALIDSSLLPLREEGAPSQPVNRNLFGGGGGGGSNQFKRPAVPQPLNLTVMTSGAANTSSGALSAPGASGSSESSNLLRPPPTPFPASSSISPNRPPVPAKCAAFRSGQLGAASVQSSFGASGTLGGNIKGTSPAPRTFASLATSTPPRTGLFGTGATPFGSTTTGTTGTGLFGSTAAKPATGGLFGSSGTTLGGIGAGQQQQQQQQHAAIQQQQVIQQYHPFVKAVGNPQITGTDNDKHIANLNQVAAALGCGKAPYKEGGQVQTFDMKNNVFEKFVGIGYNKISEHSDDEGFVSLVLRHPVANLNTEERRAKILEVIMAILGNQQNIKVLYAPGTSLRQLSDDCTEICIICKEGGFVVPACKLSQVLNDAPRMTQLENQLAVDKTRVLPKVGMSKAQKDRYLEMVPEGIDERIWRQAIAENPAPNKLLPVAVRGWEALRDRQKAQVMETKIYQEAMHSLGDRIEKAGNDYARATVEMEQIRNKHKQLAYRLIRILLAQWITARFSRQIDTDEDRIEAKCDTLLAQINRNHQIKFFIDRFYEILETRADKLQESMFTQFDMTIKDQHYARRILTELLYISEGIIAMSNLQVEELEACRRTLEG